jgi:hypothetical protein
MDPDTLDLLTVTKGQLKAARRQLSTLARLCAVLEERLEAESTAQPEEAQRNERHQHEE